MNLEAPPALTKSS